MQIHSVEARGLRLAIYDDDGREAGHAFLYILKNNFHTEPFGLLEDVFVVDALSLYIHPSRVPGKGLLGSDLAALEVLDGTTIRPLLDVRGGTPRPPASCPWGGSWGGGGLGGLSRVGGGSRLRSTKGGRAALAD